MSANALPIERYSFSSADALLVDACVWLYVYGPQTEPKRDPQAVAYSNALGRLLAAGCAVYVDVLVISEFINRYSRTELKLSRSRGRRWPDFKSFRKSKAFQPVAKAIADSVRRILKESSRAGSGFESMDAEALLARYETETPDFNDEVLTELCKRNGWKLITDDGDFRDCGVTVLTANRRLLS